MLHSITLNKDENINFEIACFSDDESGSFIAISYSDNSVFVIDTTTWNQKFKVQVKQRITCILLHSFEDNADLHLLVADKNNEVYSYHLNEGDPSKSLEANFLLGHTGSVISTMVS